MNLGRFAFTGGSIHDNTFSNSGYDGLQGGIQSSTITANVFKGNGRYGLALTGFGGSGDSTRGAQNDTVTCNGFLGNGFAQSGAGILLSSGQYPGTISTNTINQNNIFGNADGLVYSGGETIDATGNYWGTAAGPTSSSNPGGRGDTVVGSTITFSPFESFPVACVPAAGQPPAIIPTASHASLALITLLLAITGLLAVRFRIHS